MALFHANHTLTQVACTIIWQPWAIKSATPTALKHAFSDVINFVLQHELLVYLRG